MGIPTLISTHNVTSSTASVAITDDIDGTYDEYMFVFTDYHPSADVNLDFNLSIDGGSNYNVTKTTSFFTAQHNESDANAVLQINAAYDLAQATGAQYLTYNGVKAENADESAAGILHLFSPANTTYVKHFYGVSSTYSANLFEMTSFYAGYGNTASAVDAILFDAGASNIDNITIQMFGIK
tara:strand:+ start:412 stop:957 length:546 start_codon:yes stop_codon:yes gene_type:complete